MTAGLSLCKESDFDKVSQISGVDTKMLKKYFGYNERLERVDKVIAIRVMDKTKMPLSVLSEARREELTLQ